MKEIIYRKINKKDYNYIKIMMKENFHLYEYIDNDKILESFLNVYLYSCLAEKTFDMVAEMDNRAIGVILGNAKSQNSIFKSFIYSIKLGYYSIITFLKAKKEKININKYKKLTEIYKKLIEETNKKFDGILTLFVVDSVCQGCGIGKKLLREFLKYEKENNVKNLYLYTDTNCNYKFYDKNGFNKINESTFNVTNKDKNFDLGIFLYEYNFN